QRLQRQRDRGALCAGARGGDQDAQLTTQQCCERLDPLTRDLVVRLILAETLTLRIQADHIACELLQVGVPALCVRWSGGQDDRESRRRDIAAQPGCEHRARGARQPAKTQQLPARREALGEFTDSGTPPEGVKNLLQWLQLLAVMQNCGAERT